MVRWVCCNIINPDSDTGHNLYVSLLLTPDDDDGGGNRRDPCVVYQNPKAFTNPLVQLLHCTDVTAVVRRYVTSPGGPPVSLGLWPEGRTEA